MHEPAQLARAHRHGGLKGDRRRRVPSLGRARLDSGDPKREPGRLGRVAGDAKREPGRVEPALAEQHHEQGAEGGTLTRGEPCGAAALVVGG
ncbi:hypothetical protein, partial [Cryobacterium sp. MLB-32]|uniref:hypothetical protein n=1 Tax=Cryobacterium sp. MLB-32 TaxID=1529318 RepID=UPI00056359F7